MDKKIRVLIAEDIPQQSDILIHHLESMGNVEVKGVARDSQELLNVAIELKDELDALILDIELGDGRSGLDTYIRLPYRGVELPAILVTGANPEAPETYDVGIIDVVGKPYTFERIQKAVEKLVEHLQYKQYIQDGGIMVPIYDALKIVQIPLSEVLCIQASKEHKHQLVQTLLEEYHSHISLKVYLNFLLPHHYHRVDRSTLVNLRAVKEIHQNSIVFKGSTFELQRPDVKNDKNLLTAWSHAQVR
ncbi:MULTISPECIES: LytR/AlgR family response regulator transcription factor [Paenibacillus]|uniref:Response regulator n=1 Tax=Paenibacillus vandeheii TaxID=3035917 RepID=A0ABT8JGF7_9BACL|nr:MULTISPECIES: response regulator [Paenibacillus]KGP81386.1 hypothetical protein P363_0128260 [Paenibacillus sp. MAEPY1]KGP82022.1 hypothetical protein P364_0114515 [Paenibacillus sp. MAEPY2]MDN4603943.1 response regulator [Paenibacillus vandeheii]